jgi:hypothetical protein
MFAYPYIQEASQHLALSQAGSQLVSRDRSFD